MHSKLGFQDKIGIIGIQCIQHSDCTSLMAKTRKVQIDFLTASFLFKFSLTYFVGERASEIVGVYNCSFALWDCNRLSSADFNLLTLKPVHWLCQRPALFSVLSVFACSYHVFVCLTWVKRFISPIIYLFHKSGRTLTSSLLLHEYCLIFSQNLLLE